MQEFNDGGKTNRARAALSCRVPVAQQQQRGTQPLAATPQEIAGHLGHRRESHFALAREFLFHQNQVVADQVKNLLSRKQRDDFPPNPNRKRTGGLAVAVSRDAPP